MAATTFARAHRQLLPVPQRRQYRESNKSLNGSVSFSGNSFSRTCPVIQTFTNFLIYSPGIAIREPPENHVGVETKSMLYKVVFQRADREIETLYWNGSLEETISLARSAMFECEFEEFHIIESAGSGAEVFSEKLPSAKPRLNLGYPR
jgi:hypothetical protein